MCAMLRRSIGDACGAHGTISADEIEPQVASHDMSKSLTFPPAASVRLPSVAPVDGLPRIPFNKPFIVGKELFYIAQAVLGGHLAGDGRFTRLCSEWLEES
jgi:hypothetical protein